VPGPATTPRARRRRRVRRTIVVVSLLIGGPVVAEAVLRARLAGARAANSIYRAKEARGAALSRYTLPLWAVRWWRYRPGLEAEFPWDDGDGTCRFTTDSRGFRTAEFATTPPPEVYRVVVLGGSTSVRGTTNARTWPGRLQALLDEVAPRLTGGRTRFEVVNLAVSGVHLLGSRRRYREEGRGYAPDAVVVYHGVNGVRGKHPLGPARLVPAITSSLLLDRLAVALADPDDLDPVVAPQLEALGDVADACARDDVLLFACTFAVPRREDFTAEEWEYLSLHARQHWCGRGADVYAWTLGVWNDRLRAFAAEDPDVALLDIAPDLRGGLDVFDDPCHLRDAGNALQARLVLERLVPELVAAGVLKE